MTEDNSPSTHAENKSGKPTSCPESPCEFFTKIADWAKLMQTWACEVDQCYSTKCKTDDRKESLDDLCTDFRDWSRDAKEWADDIEACYQKQCAPIVAGDPGSLGHTPPPPPPFLM